MLGGGHIGGMHVSALSMPLARLALTGLGAPGTQRRILSPMSALVAALGI